MVSGLGFQAQPKPLDFTPEEHTDFIFAVSDAELASTMAVVVLLAAGFVAWWWRRRRRPSDP